ncbi:MAG TPA: hypothetical protein PKL83_06280, partial [bacterium]|nr:hypothetical protein [bacterium]
MTDTTDRLNRTPAPLPLFGAAALGGLVSGIIYALIVYVIQWDFFLIFPLAISYLMYALMQRIIKKMILREYRLLLIAGMLGIALAFLTQQAGSAYLSRNREIDSLISELKKQENITISKKQSEKFIDSVYDDETGHTGTMGAFLYSLKNANISFGNSLNRDDTVGVGYAGGIVILLVEIGIAGFTLRGLLHTLLAEPFCTGCNRWKDEKQTIKLAGFAAYEPAIAALSVKNMTSLKELYDAKAAKKNDYTQLNTWRCPDCRADVIVLVEGYGRKSKRGNFKK